MTNRCHEQGQRHREDDIHLSAQNKCDRRSILVHVSDTSRKGKDTRDTMPCSYSFFLEVKHFTSAHILLATVIHMTTVHFRIHWGNAKLSCMQKEGKENVCKLFSSLLQCNKPEHFYYLGCMWAECKQARTR